MTDKEKYNGYMRAYMLERYHRRRAEAIARLGGQCVQCGSTSDLEFDHIDPSTKSFTIAKGSGYSNKRWDEELEKCQLLCVPCHESKSVLESGKAVAKGSHGTLSSYRYCRCELCRKAKSDANRQYKRKRRLGRVALH